MFETLVSQPADKILALSAAFKEDPRAEKVDLGVGVYKNAEGKTPVMAAVKLAEEKLWQTQDTKAYVALGGAPEFNAAMRQMLLADSVANDRLSSVATPGGTGAIRQAFELIGLARPDATIWYSDPTWPNHISILKYLNRPNRSYRYFDEATRGVDFAGMMDDLAAVKPGDVILLHGCCHNPTGANLTMDQWEQIADLILKTGAVAMIDIAYQGFGDGLEQDTAPTRMLASRLPEMIIAASCSKNFGIYRERTGILMTISQSAANAAIAQGTLAFLNRQNFSFPPDHGARVVTTILSDETLRANWMAELEAVRLGMLDLRQALADELRQRTNSDRFDFIAHHRGMFSRLGATPEQVETMRSTNAIYMIGDSRINIAGLNKTSIPVLASAMVAAGV